MRLTWLGVFLIASLVILVPSAFVAANGQEADAGEEVELEGVQRTFIAPIEKKADFAKEVANLKIKANPEKDGDGEIIEAAEIDELGIMLATGIFTDEAAQTLRDKGYEEAPQFEVGLFADEDCEGVEPLNAPPSGTNFVPPSVCRVVGAAPGDQSGGATVWIIDSGVDKKVVDQGLLNVGKAIDCTSSAANICVEAAGALKDKTSHGTMVAGIVGGKLNGTTGILGVSPNVKLMIVKAFRGRRANLFGPPLLALKYVKQHAAPGDILNISWGAELLEAAKNRRLFGKLGEMDRLLFDIADKPVRIVVAAGNAEDEDEDNGGWVQSIFPANTSEYLSPVTTDGKEGFIRSVSASTSRFVPAGQVETGACSGISGGWCDELWRGGSFGAVMAEPGVGIHVLWKSSKKTGLPRRNICSGTSLAAPVYAGLLARTQETINKVRIKGELIEEADQVGFITAGRPASTGPNDEFPTCRK